MLWWDPQIPPSLLSSPVARAELRKLLMDMVHRLEVTVSAPLDLTNDTAGQHIRLKDETDDSATQKPPKCEDVAKCLCVVKDVNGAVTDILYVDAKGTIQKVQVCPTGGPAPPPPGSKLCTTADIESLGMPFSLHLRIGGLHAYSNGTVGEVEGWTNIGLISPTQGCLGAPPINVTMGFLQLVDVGPMGAPAMIWSCLIDAAGIHPGGKNPGCVLNGTRCLYLEASLNCIGSDASGKQTYVWQIAWAAGNVNLLFAPCADGLGSDNIQYTAATVFPVNVQCSLNVTNPVLVPNRVDVILTE